jgi:hypothetical protein
MGCVHDEAEMRTRPSDGWEYCRICKNEKERKQRRERMKDPAKLEHQRKQTREALRKRRRDPRTREAVLAYDRKRHVTHREERLANYREYDRRRRGNGTFFVSRYGVSIEDAKRAIEAKPTGCQICGREGELVFDHCDDVKRFRGWICRQCNAAIGLLGDDADRVQAALAYLLDFRQKI